MNQKQLKESLIFRTKGHLVFTTSSELQTFLYFREYIVDLYIRSDNTYQGSISDAIASVLGKRPIKRISLEDQEKLTGCSFALKTAQYCIIKGIYDENIIRNMIYARKWLEPGMPGYQVTEDSDVSESTRIVANIVVWYMTELHTICMKRERLVFDETQHQFSYKK